MLFAVPQARAVLRLAILALFVASFSVVAPACHRAELIESTPLPASAAYRTLRIEVVRTGAVDDKDRDVLGTALVERFAGSKRLELAAASTPADLVLKISILSVEQSGGSGPATVTARVDFVNRQGKAVGELEATATGTGRRAAVGSGNVMITVDKERDLHPALRDIAHVVAQYVESRAR